MSIIFLLTVSILIKFILNFKFLGTSYRLIAAIKNGGTGTPGPYMCYRRNNAGSWTLFNPMNAEPETRNRLPPNLISFSAFLFQRN